MHMYDVIIKNGTVVNHDGRHVIGLGLRDGKVAAIGDMGQAHGGQIIDATGLHVLPGVIDTQVHFREPGLEHKENLESGSHAAVLGGVTGVFEMPNTNPTTSTAAMLEDKLRRARARMHCHYAFYVGGTHENADDLHELECLPGCCGVKVFMGASTGDLLIADEAGLKRVLASIRRRASFHSEDEARMAARRHLARAGDWTSHGEVRDAMSALIATRRLIKLARQARKRIHILHISTAEEIPLLSAHKDLVSCEVTPQHLTLYGPDIYQRIEGRAQMNPPLRDQANQAGLWQGLASGVFDVLGSDHAPHTLEEKNHPYPSSPSGMPGVQTLVPIMLDWVARGALSLERFVDMTSHSPNRLWGLAGKGRLAVGYDADITIVDLKKQVRLTDTMMASRCGWTPFADHVVTGFPTHTIIDGKLVMAEQELLLKGQGQAYRFEGYL